MKWSIRKNMIYYAGIGSRETPQKVLDGFQSIGTILAKRGYCLRSGRADGADKSFEIGCDKANGRKEIYLPWKGFNGSNSNLFVGNLQKEAEAISIASKYHPAWDKCKDGAKKLMQRNTYQVLGQDLETPSDFVICYTDRGLEKGGTAQAIRIAKDNDIPIFNVGNYCNYENDTVMLNKEICNKAFKEFIYNVEHNKNLEDELER